MGQGSPRTAPFSIGLQVCRPHRLGALLDHLRHAQSSLGCSVHIVVDRFSPGVQAVLKGSAFPFVHTGGIGNWTSKNVLLRECLADAESCLLLEDDVEFLRSDAIAYLAHAYRVARQFLGFYKLNSPQHRSRHEVDFRGRLDLGDMTFNAFATFNTSAVLLLDRPIVDRIGYFCNSYYEIGFYDYRDRLREAGLVGNLLSPVDLAHYLRVDDEMPSTIPREHRALYRRQVFPPAVNAYRPFDDRPAFVASEAER